MSLTVKMFSTGAKWLIGKVVRETGPVSYLIALNDGRLIRRHVDHIRKRLDLEIPEVSVDPKIPLVSNSDDVPTSWPTVKVDQLHQISKSGATKLQNALVRQGVMGMQVRRVRSLAGYVNLPENEINRFVMAITFMTKNYGGRVLYIETILYGIISTTL